MAYNMEHLSAGNMEAGSRPWSIGRRTWRSARPACAVALLLSDAASFALSFAVVWLLASSGMLPPPAQWEQHDLSGQAVPTLIAFACILAGLAAYFTAQGHYHRRLPFWQELHQVLLASVFALLCQSFMEFAFKTSASRLLVLGTWVLFPAVLLGVRQLTRRILTDAGLWQIRTIIVGWEDAAERVISALTSEPKLGYAVVGVVSPASVARLPESRRWMRLTQRFRAHLVVLAPGPGQRLDRTMNEGLVREQVPFAVMPQSEGLPVSGCVNSYFFKHDMIMLSYRKTVSQPLERAAKVALDLFGAACLILLVSPVLLAIALAVKLDGGPVFFAHPRLGAGKRRFPCLKFRSMRQDSAEVLQEVLRQDPAAAAEWAATQKLRQDPRVTRVGAFLRKTSLDELPQLFNVMRLEMSLVGPRPIVDSEVGHYADNIAYYYATRPGLTGLWQVSGRSDTTYAERVQLDTWYVKNWTLWHDVAILAKTVPAVLKRRGAV